MSKEFITSTIVRKFAQEICRSLIKKAIAELDAMAADLSGEESNLSSVWEEICVQVQWQESHSWDFYLDTMRDLLEGQFLELPSHHQQAIWLQTDEGALWDGSEQNSQPDFIEESVTYLIDEYLLPEAGSCTNQEIQTYLQRARAGD